MPLRLRLIASIGLVLLLSLACGSVLVGLHEANSVETELRAALEVGANMIRNGIEELAHVDDRPGASRHLVATFNGNRHVRATLIDARDQRLAASALFVPAQPVPVWFRGLIGGDSHALRFPVPAADGADGAIVLQTDPANELGEVWAESRDAVLVLAGFAASSALLICAVVGRALQPLENLANAFDRIGEGDYHGRAREQGPPELIRLARGFNAMTRRLAAAAARNRRLNERLLTLQAEERADLARDLHDEIGPLLFAVDMTAATIEQVARRGQESDIPAHVRSIQDAIGRIQRHVRGLLGRLRPIPTIGLETAIRRLVAFWHSRCPDITFVIGLAVDEERIGDDLRETIYRVVQEGMSNAIRHGKPARIEVTIEHAGTDGIRVQVVDDGTGMTRVAQGGEMVDGAVARDANRLGLIGMRERVMAMAGSLSIQRGRDGKGLALVGWLPCVASLEAHDQEGVR